MPDTDHAITVTRIFDASADELYAAWTEPELMRRWMAREVTADVRVGGHYRNNIDAGDAGAFIHAGEYLVLEPGRRVVQSFQGGSEEPDPNHRDFLEITFRALGPDQTELTLVDGWDGEALDAEGQEAARQAWSGWLDGLDGVIG